MANRIVTAAVTGETIKLSEKNAGAAGSFNAVSLSFTFDTAWDGTTKKVYFFDTYGANAVYTLLTTDLLVDGKYIVPIPAEPLVHAGEMTITVKGVDFATDGATAERIVMSASTTMKVLNAITPASDVTPVEPTPTQAEQLLASVNSVTGMTVTSETLPSGSSATVAKTINPDSTVNIGFGLPTGSQGVAGRSIVSVIKTGTVGLTDTYTITFSDSTTQTFSVSNGYTPIKGTDYFDGAVGNGIASVVLHSGNHAAGTTDTYRITFTDTTTFDFTVYNGANGTGAVTSITGTLPIVSTGGNNPAVSINAATTSAAGSMSAADKTKLDGISNTNVLHNSNFDINQRFVSGAVTLAAGAYGHDRWKAGASGCTYTFATSGGIATVTITSGSLVQIIEGDSLETGTYCLSWAGTANGKIGTGSYGASGITSSVTGDSNLSIEFSTGTLSKPKLECFGSATPWRKPPYGEQLAKCQRYLIKLLRFTVFLGTTSNPNDIDFMVILPVSMRIVPTVVNNGFISGFTTSVIAGSDNNSFQRLRATKANHGLSGLIIFEVSDDNTYLSAEL